MIIELGKFVLNQPQRFQAAIRVRLCGGDVRSQILSCVINRFQEQANVFVCALEAIEWGFGFVQSNLPVKAAPTTRGIVPLAGDHLCIFSYSDHSRLLARLGAMCERRGNLD